MSAHRLADPAIAFVVDALVARLERGDRPATLAFRALDETRRAALADLLGLSRLPPADFRLSVARLAAACREDGLDGLARATEALRGPLADRPGARLAAARRKAALWERLSDGLAGHAARLGFEAAGVERAVAAQRAAGAADADVPARESDVEALLTTLARLPGDARLPGNGRGLALLAADALGDPHALDRDRALGRLVVETLAAALGLPRPDVPETWHATWRRVGVVPDGVSSTALALGLRVSAAHPFHGWLEASRDAAEPVALTLRQLERFPLDAVPPDALIRVVENPSIVEAAARAGRVAAPLVCSAGQPTLAVRTLLGQLAARGARIEQHADFDAGGLRIVRWLGERLDARPWRMSAADYRGALGASRAALPPLPPALPDTPWDPALGAAMAEAGRVASEELMVDALLADLESARIPAAVLQAYRAAAYRVHDDPAFALRVDERAPALAAAHARRGVERSAFVTACNPLGRELPAEDNGARHAELGRELARRGLARVEGIGESPAGDWQGEPSWLVFGLDPDGARRLGEELEQNAVLWSGDDAVPRLLVLR